MYYAYEVTTTQKCDMACTYCFEGEELNNKTPQLHTSDIIRSIRDLLESEKFMEKFTGITLNFWGGEPTLNPKMIINLINEFKDEPIDFFLYTNGFNISNLEKIINNFKLFIKDSTRFSYQISYDGIFHDKERVDHQGNGTSDMILKNIRILNTKYPDINLSLKSTLTIEDLLNLEENWYHFKDIRDEFPRFEYSPTLEYTNKYDITHLLLKLEKDFLILAKKELDFYKKHDRFLWTWFGSGERNLCSAGMNISNIDLDGNLLVCHGALYSPNKEKFIIGNVDNIANDIVASHHAIL